MSGHKGTGAAPGKVILFGEHAVVHGQPAIAAALGIGLGATATACEGPAQLHIPAWDTHIQLKGGADFDALARGFKAALTAVGLEGASVSVTLDGALPPSVGLGSSAAFAVALIRALSGFARRPLDHEGTLKAADAVERVFHGNPSGLDHTVATLGGCLRYTRGPQGPSFTPISMAQPMPVIVAWTPRLGSTRQAVAQVGARYARWPDLIGGTFTAIGEIAEAGAKALEAGDFERIGVLFDLNHGHLNALGVSCPESERLVALARQAGALGAKITGAGLGGAIIAVSPPDPQPLLDAFDEAGCAAFATTVGR